MDFNSSKLIKINTKKIELEKTTDKENSKIATEFAYPENTNNIKVLFSEDTITDRYLEFGMTNIKNKEIIDNYGLEESFIIDEENQFKPIYIKILEDEKRLYCVFSYNLTEKRNITVKAEFYSE